jgi:hypothetical protein
VDDEYCSSVGCTFAAFAGGECERHHALHLARIEEMQRADRARQERDPSPEPASPIYEPVEDAADVYRSHDTPTDSRSSWKRWKRDHCESGFA